MSYHKQHLGTIEGLPVGHGDGYIFVYLCYDRIESAGTKSNDGTELKHCTHDIIDIRRKRYIITSSFS